MAFDIITPSQLGRGAINTSATVFYTVDNLERAIVKSIDIANTNASPVSVTVYLVPSTSSPAVSNTLLPSVTINGNTIFSWCGAQVLNAGDTIRAVASQTGATIHISGGSCV